MISIAIVDSGPLIATANRSDPAHSSCLAVLRRADLHLVIPALCVAEAAYLIQRQCGAVMESRFVEGLASFDVQAPEPDDWPRMAQLMRQYSDLPLGAADASVVAAAERLGTKTVVTLDRRHFHVLRPAHCEGLVLLP